MKVNLSDKKLSTIFKIINKKSLNSIKVIYKDNIKENLYVVRFDQRIIWLFREYSNIYYMYPFNGPCYMLVYSENTSEGVFNDIIKENSSLLFPILLPEIINDQLIKVYDDFTELVLENNLQEVNGIFSTSSISLNSSTESLLTMFDNAFGIEDESYANINEVNDEILITILK